MMKTETNDSRNRILASIRRNLDASLPFDAAHHRHHYVSYVPLNSIPFEDPVSRFAAALEAVGGNCLIAENEADATQTLAQIISAVNAEKIVVSASKLVERVLPTELDVKTQPTKEELFDCNLGITGAQFAVAETGTLVLESGRENNRLISLVPPIHVCLVETKTIRQKLSEVLSELETNLSPAVTFITGPSRTSDIELTLAIGVHGPRELFAILIGS